MAVVRPAVGHVQEDGSVGWQAASEMVQVLDGFGSPIRRRWGSVQEIDHGCSSRNASSRASLVAVLMSLRSSGHSSPYEQEAVMKGGPGRCRFDSDTTPPSFPPMRTPSGTDSEKA